MSKPRKSISDKLRVGDVCVLKQGIWFKIGPFLREYDCLQDRNELDRKIRAVRTRPNCTAASKKYVLCQICSCFSMETTCYVTIHQRWALPIELLSPIAIRPIKNYQNIGLT